MPDYEPLWYWVREREEIRKRKLSSFAHAWPWTDDPILAKYRFCNVRREDDRVTIWIRENIRERFAGHHHLWLMLCIARQVNWPDTLSYLIQTERAWPSDASFNPACLGDALNDRQAQGDKVYTGAYMISAPSTKGANKQDYIAQVVIGALWQRRAGFEAVFNNLEIRLSAVHSLLTEHNGWGPFMAYQAIVDMRFTALLENAVDRETWCASGPGTIRGLNRLHDRPLDKQIDQSQARTEIRKIWETIRQETGVDMDFSDVPNCLCETDKYLRVKNGEGTPRALYVPGRGC